MTTERKTTADCPRCRKLEKEISRLREGVSKLEAQIARLKKDSSTSSKPPSSDIVKKKRKTRRPKAGKRKRGGRPGHPRHERKPFDPPELDYIHTYYWDRCPCCGGPLEIRHEQARVIQQAEFIERPIEIHEYRSVACWCPQCEETHYASIPEDIRKAGLTGPRLTALVAFMKCGCRCSFSTIRKFLRDVVGIKISRGHLRNLCAKVSESLKGCYDELMELLVHEAVLNVDETANRDYGKRLVELLIHHDAGD